PFFGTGPGTYYLVSKQFEQAPSQYSWFAHNFVLQQIVEIGIIGTVLFSFLLITIIRPAFIAIFFKNNHNSHAYYLISGLILIFANSLFDYNMDFIIIWCIFWFSLSLISI